MPTMEELSSFYCEDYSDQDGGDFRFLSYTPYMGETHVEVVTDNLAKQTYEIYRRFGKKTRIRVYR